MTCPTCQTDDCLHIGDLSEVPVDAEPVPQVSVRRPVTVPARAVTAEDRRAWGREAAELVARAVALGRCA